MSDDVVNNTNKLIEGIGGYSVLFAIAVQKAGGQVDISVDDILTHPAVALEVVSDSESLRFVTTGENNE